MMKQSDFWDFVDYLYDFDQKRFAKAKTKKERFIARCFSILIMMS